MPAGGGLCSGLCKYRPLNPEWFGIFLGMERVVSTLGLTGLLVAGFCRKRAISAVFRGRPVMRCAAIGWSGCDRLKYTYRAPRPLAIFFWSCEEQAAGEANGTGRLKAAYCFLKTWRRTMRT